MTGQSVRPFLRAYVNASNVSVWKSELTRGARAWVRLQTWKRVRFAQSPKGERNTIDRINVEARSRFLFGPLVAPQTAQSDPRIAPLRNGRVLVWIAREDFSTSHGNRGCDSFIATTSGVYRVSENLRVELAGWSRIIRVRLGNLTKYLISNVAKYFISYLQCVKFRYSVQSLRLKA